jgi:hypothetical protein
MAVLYSNHSTPDRGIVRDVLRELMELTMVLACSLLLVGAMYLVER